MTVIIAGTRGNSDPETLLAAIDTCGWQITRVVSGCEPTGADRLGEDWAAFAGVPVVRFPAEWDRYGKSAGPRRNECMAAFAAECGGRLLCLWNGESAGTANMLRQGAKFKLPTFIYYI